MSFINYPSPTPVFPVLSPLTWPVKKKPIFSTQVSTAISGREMQLLRAIYPRWEFELTYGGDSWLRDQTQNIVTDSTRAGQVELEYISGLFLECLGAYGEFYFDDPDDDSRSSITIGVGDGVTSTYRLYHTWGTGPFIPPFRDPIGGINSIDAVYLNGVLQSAATYAPDASNTKIVFSPVPSLGAVITASYHFYFRCSFMEDVQQYEEWAKNLWEYKSVKFKSVKP